MNHYLPFEYIQFLNQKVVENLHIPYTVVGNKFNFKCPFCGDSKKSATKRRGWFYLENSSFYCFNCGLGLSGIKFLEAISGEKYSDIKREYMKMLFNNRFSSELSSHFEKPPVEPSIFEMTSVVKTEWKNKLTEKAKQYLTNRKVLSAPFMHEQFYSCFGKNSDEYILIPWTINGVDAYYQLNDFQKLHGLKYIFPKLKKKLLYGLDNIDISFPYIILFEGVYDSLFVKNGIATGTKAVTDYQLSLIKDRYPHHQIVVSFDNDISGLESMMKMIKKGEDFKYFRWFNKNTNEKDINEYILVNNDVNIFTDSQKLERLIVDKLSMKLFLIQCGIWKSDYRKNNDSSTYRKTRKIQ